MEDKYAAQAKQKVRQKALWAGYKIQAGTAAIDNVVAHAQQKCSVRIREETKVETFTPRHEMDAYDIRAMARRLATENDAQERLRRFEEMHSSDSLYKSAMENAEKAREEAGELKTGHKSFLRGDSYVEKYKSANHSPYDPNFYYSEIQENVEDYYTYGTHMSSGNRYESSLGVPDMDGAKNDLYSGYGEDVVNRSAPEKENGFGFTPPPRDYDDDPTAGMDFGHDDYAPHTATEEFHDDPTPSFYQQEMERMDHELYGYQNDAEIHTASTTQQYEHDESLRTERDTDRYSHRDTQSGLKTDTYEGNTSSGPVRTSTAEASDSARTEQQFRDNHNNSYDNPIRTGDYHADAYGSTGIKTAGSYSQEGAHDSGRGLRTGESAYTSPETHGIRTARAEQSDGFRNSASGAYDNPTRTGYTDAPQTEGLKTGSMRGAETRAEHYDEFQNDVNRSYDNPTRTSGLKTGSQHGTETRTGTEHYDDFQNNVNHSYENPASTNGLKTSSMHEAETRTGTERHDNFRNNVNHSYENPTRTGGNPYSGVERVSPIRTGETLHSGEERVSGLKTGSESSYGSVRSGTDMPGLKTAHEDYRHMSDSGLKTGGYDGPSDALRTGRYPESGTTGNTIHESSPLDARVGNHGLKTADATSPVGTSPKTFSSSKNASAERSALRTALVRDADGQMTGISSGGSISREKAVLATENGRKEFYVLKTGTGTIAANSEGIGHVENGAFVAESLRTAPVINESGAVVGIQTGNRFSSEVSSLNTGDYFTVHTDRGVMAVDKSGTVGRIEGGGFISEQALKTGIPMRNEAGQITGLRTGDSMSHDTAILSTPEGNGSFYVIKTANGIRAADASGNIGYAENGTFVPDRILKTGNISPVTDETGKIAGIRTGNTVSRETAVLSTPEGTGKFFIVKTPGGIQAVDAAGNTGRAENGTFIPDIKTVLPSRDEAGKITGIRTGSTVSHETAVLSTPEGTGKFFIIKTPGGIRAVDSAGNTGRAENGAFIPDVKTVLPSRDETGKITGIRTGSAVSHETAVLATAEGNRKFFIIKTSTGTAAIDAAGNTGKAVDGKFIADGLKTTPVTDGNGNVTGVIRGNVLSKKVLTSPDGKEKFFVTDDGKTAVDALGNIGNIENGAFVALKTATVKNSAGEIIGLRTGTNVSHETAILTTPEGTGKFFILKTGTQTIAVDAAGNMGHVENGAFVPDVKSSLKGLRTNKPTGTIIRDSGGKIIGVAAPGGKISRETAILATASGTGKFFVIKTATGTVAVDAAGNIGKAEGGRFIAEKAAAAKAKGIKTSVSSKFGGIKKVGFNAKQIGKTSIHASKTFAAEKIGKAAKKITGHESWMELTGNFFSAKTAMPLSAKGPESTIPLKTKGMASKGEEIVTSKGKKAIVLRTKAARKKGILDQFSKKKNIKGGFVVANNFEEFVKFKNKKKVVGLYTAENGFASIKDGKLKTSSGNIIATSKTAKKGILGGLKTKTVTITSDGSVVKKITKTAKETSPFLLKTARGGTKVLRTVGKGASAAGTFTSFMQGVEAGDTKSWTVAQGKKFVMKRVHRTLSKVASRLLAVIRNLLKKALAFFAKLLLAFWPVALALISAACICSIFGFLAGDKKTWDNYSDFIISTTEHLQSDASSCSSVEITGRDTIDWKGVFSITEGFYDCESDTKNVKPVLAWFKGNSDTGVLSRIKNTIFNGGFGTTNHMYKFSSDGGSGTIHIYNYNDMLEAFVKSNIWKERVGKAKTPDLEPYKFRLDDSYSTTLDVGSTGSEGDADISDATSLIDGGSDAAKKFVEFALKERGKPYVWGACGPNTFDCSGLVYYCIHNTVDPHYARTDTRGIASNGWKTIKNFSDLKTGDVLVFSSSGSFGGIHHVGIYIGSGKMVHAPHTGDVVKISDVTHGYYRNQFYCGKRPFKDE